MGVVVQLPCNAALIVQKAGCNRQMAPQALSTYKQLKPSVFIFLFLGSLLALFFYKI